MENIDRLSNLLHLPADVYFVSTVRDVFDEYFAERGAFPMAHCGASMMRYEAPEWFAEVIYLPSDGPRYSPRVELGVIPEPFVDPRRNRIDVLHTTPIDSDLQTYNLTWRYTNSHEARHAFVRDYDVVYRSVFERCFTTTNTSGKTIAGIGSAMERRDPAAQ